MCWKSLLSALVERAPLPPHTPLCGEDVRCPQAAWQGTSSVKPSVPGGKAWSAGEESSRNWTQIWAKQLHTVPGKGSLKAATPEDASSWGEAQAATASLLGAVGVDLVPCTWKKVGSLILAAGHCCLSPRHGKAGRRSCRSWG